VTNLKILFVNENGTAVGGAESHIGHLFEALQRKGIESFLFSSARSESGETIMPRDRIVFSHHPSGPCSRIRNGASARTIKRTIKKFNIDIVHAHNIFSTISPYFLKSCGVPAILTLHDYHIICPKTIQFLRDRSLPCLKECDMRKCLGPAKYRYEVFKRKRWAVYLENTPIIAPSSYLEKEVRKRGMTRVTTIHNGVPTPGIALRSREHIGLIKEVFHLVFTGRLYPEKGVLPMLKAFKRFLDGLDDADRDGIKLTLTGDGPLRDEVSDYSRRYTEIDYLGFIPRKRLSEILSSTTFLVLPSIWPENCSMAVLEAMQRGIPVITSNMGGTPELVRDKKEAYLMDFVSAFSKNKSLAEENIIKIMVETFIRAYLARERIPAMVKNCYRIIEKKFSSDIMADKIIAEYRRLG